MPCNSDYLNANDIEIERQRAAKLLVYVRKAQGIQPPPYAVKAAKSCYGEGGDKAIVELCDTLRGMTEAELDFIVYNPYSKSARDLANWWEEHQEADRKRMQAERTLKQKAVLRKSAVSKLTKAELKALQGE